MSSILNIPANERVIPLDKWLSLSLREQSEKLTNGYWPQMAGAEGEGGGEGGGSGSGEGAGAGGAGGSGEGEGGTGSGEGGGSGSGSGGEEDEDDDEDILEIRRSDYERLRAAHRKQEKAERDREAAERKAREDRLKAEGQFDEMLAEERQQREAIEAERDSARLELYNERRQARVKRIAGLLGFKDPEDALHNITDEDSEDDAKAERALRKVAKRKPYLVDSKRSTGAPIGNGTGGGKVKFTMDQVRNMSRTEIQENWEAVQEAMAAAGGGEMD